MREQGRRSLLASVLATVPLLAAALYHLIAGGSLLILAVAGAAVLLVVAAELLRSRLARRRRRGAGWRATVPVDSWAGLPRVVRLLRDSVPVLAEVTPDVLRLTPPRRYRRLGVGVREIRVAGIRRVEREVLGHVRPDGTISFASVTAISVVLKRGPVVDLLFEAGGDDFRGAVQRGLIHGRASSGR